MGGLLGGGGGGGGGGGRAKAMLAPPLSNYLGGRGEAGLPSSYAYANKRT